MIDVSSVHRKRSSASMSLPVVLRFHRRRLLRLAAGLPLLPIGALAQLGSGVSQAPEGMRSRLRPGHPAWPSEARWKALGDALGDALMPLRSPWAECLRSPSGAACTELFKSAKNPYVLGDDPALTQTFGWVDAWTSMPSVYAVAARHTADVVAAVNFARQNRLRLV